MNTSPVVPPAAPARGRVVRQSLAAAAALSLSLAALAAQVGAQAPGRAAGPHEHRAPEPGTRPGGADSAAVERDIARLRTSLARYRSLDAAAAAGYARAVPACVAHPRLGGMGFHHENASLMDARLELDRPEILVYGRAPDGRHQLNGVEYVVPYAAHPRDAAPPAILGQPLRRADELQIWYLHVWLWEENPSGVFAAWNPKVTC